jgi:hypothetical protein
MTSKELAEHVLDGKKKWCVARMSAWSEDTILCANCKLNALTETESDCSHICHACAYDAAIKLATAYLGSIPTQPPGQSERIKELSDTLLKQAKELAALAQESDRAAGAVFDAWMTERNLVEQLRKESALTKK